MTRAPIPLLTLALTILGLPVTPSRADDLDANPDDPGRITAIHRGVWELDVGALGILASDHQGDATVTRLSVDTSLTLSRFIKNNVSIGVAGLFDYDSSGGGNHAAQLGGALQATVHFRLGLGAFFRPGIAVGGLYGTRDTSIGPGMLEAATQLGVITRLQFPLAYFASKRVVLQAGPQLNFTAGRYTPTGGTSHGFTRIAGGFAIGAGYAF